MNKPHIRKCEAVNGEMYHCSLRRGTLYWHEYGKTMRDAYEKMMARVDRIDGARLNEPTSAQ